jgi:hypothetical protein
MPRFFPSRDTKGFERERSLLLHHEEDGSTELVGEDGKGLGLAVLSSKFLDVTLRRRICAQEEDGGLGERPLQVRVSDLSAAHSELFPRRALFALHEPCVGSEILYPFEAVDIVDFVKQGEGENFPHSGNGAEAVEVVHVVDLGFLSEEKLEVFDESVIVSGELDIGRDTLGNGRV